MIRGLESVAKKLGIAPEPSSKPDRAKPKDPCPTIAELALEPPMMYRAQVQGRCSLQFASKPADLNQWTEEWIYPAANQQPTYQHQEPAVLGWDGAIYRIKIEFPFRLCSNCGQDSILRPVIGKHGIPLITGSSIKGLFRRACSSRQQAIDYCGDDAGELTPGKLRFHGAYPVGDWAGTRRVTFQHQGQAVSETRYRLVDVVHPQQERQVKGTGSATAIALISFYQPTMIFELSSTKPDETDWKEVAGLLKTALRQGLGGKTNTGYGLPFIPKDQYAFTVYLDGVGVSPLLRSNEPEFRPNLFKATLRGHVRRLLAGVCDEDAVKQKENQLFGHTAAPAEIELFWESKAIAHNTLGGNPTYRTKGTLYVDTKQQQDLESLGWVLRFAVVMGGFGKSWRRVWHQQFYQSNPNYSRPIGCHWKADSDQVELDFKTSQDLKHFLDQLYQFCGDRFGAKPSQSLKWKESWHPKRVAVFSQIVTQSKAIDLFHDPTFKTTPAIGGKNPGDDRPTSVSSVWHRMFPIGGTQYLEIVTVFHGDRDPWKREGEDQLPAFIQTLKKQGLALTWGNEPLSK